MSIILIIILILLGFFFFILFVKYTNFKRYILNQFKRCNVLVYGSKGSGKDVLFQYVINKLKDFYYSNIPYGGKYKLISIKDLSLEPNNYEDLINNNIVKSNHKFKDGKNVYLSDLQNYLPNYMDNNLYKKYPSFPIYYALSRHLYNQNIHGNSQAFERSWKVFREQGDFYIKCLRTIKLPHYLIVKVRTYDKYESAKANLLPLKARHLNKYSKAQVDLYNAQNGKIIQGFIFIKKSAVKYDTRYFEKLFLKGRRKH